MNKQFGNEDPRLAAYVSSTYTPEDDVLADIRVRSAAAGLPDIQVAPLDARHLEVLARTAGARRAVEIGTLGGYSGVAILRGMGAAGTLDTIEVEPRHAELARETFRRAGFVRDRARIHIGRAADVLPRLSAPGAYDLVFVDADKQSYPLYLDWASDNLRPGGMVLLDNAFLFGHLPEEAAGERAAEIAAMQAVHEALANSGNWRATVLPTGEGLALGVKL
jgi:caffeoyl-CoA O-methyltransferase